MRDKFQKIIIALALIIGFVSAAQYIFATFSETFMLFGKSELFKQDYVEMEYKNYRVYRYFLWLKDVVPGGEPYGLFTAPGDRRLHARYLHRLNYFLYPEHILPGTPKYVFAPKLDEIMPPATHNGKAYKLIAKKDNTGVFVRK